MVLGVISRGLNVPIVFVYFLILHVFNNGRKILKDKGMLHKPTCLHGNFSSRIEKISGLSIHMTSKTFMYYIKDLKLNTKGKENVSIFSQKRISGISYDNLYMFSYLNNI